MNMADREVIQLIHEIKSQQLLHELVVQLNKDADLSGLEVNFSSSSTPEKLVKQLYNVLVDLMTNDFRAYLNFLYRIDLSEQKLKSIPETEPKQIAEIVTFLVLKREWQKVAFRNKSQ